ncbi:MAG: hypothetical protein K1Y02_18865 [Candidatus Hydrogenedentes bacterium]|nr:hypothetical protein [Candidatus Hydrogenedentota bacterium]
MQATNLFLLFTRRLNGAGIPHMISGSTAAILYGEPRLTNDVDMIVFVKRGDAGRVVDAFPLSEFYCPPEEVIAVEAARALRGHFNIIHHETGFKADLYLSGDDPLHAWGLARARRVQIGEETVVVAPPEYVIVRKLEYFREGHSQKHLNDIRAMLRNMPELAASIELKELLAERGLAESWQIAVCEV